MQDDMTKVENKNDKDSSPPLYSFSWGWNSGGRAGSIAYTSISQPKQIQHSVEKRYISAVAGSHHSLILSDDGLVYSLGEDSKGQLGLGNAFVKAPTHKRVTRQSYPMQITPSGELQSGRDVIAAQVDCGESFSLLRELSADEALSLRKGFMGIEKALQHLRGLYPDCDSINAAWCELQQERSAVSRLAQGKIASWGTGAKGQLGCGVYDIYCPYPRIVPKLRGVSIIQIAAGRTHVLAISSSKNLFSWGSGRYGKLGHLDFKDRFEPTIVDFFVTTSRVEFCAAGDNHSAVMIADRDDNRAQPVFRISTFGCGTHGQIGNGKNLNSNVPVLVSEFPASTRDMQLRQVACGGAHTLALAFAATPTGLSNPWGMRTCVLAWGYGGNGQLGNGYTKDSFVPVKVRTNRIDIVVELSAGRSWSLARLIDGRTLSWGKGLRGQLGRGADTQFSLVPKEINYFAPSLAISAGFTHNIAVGVPKKHFVPARAHAATLAKVAANDVIEREYANTNNRDKTLLHSLVPKALRAVLQNASKPPPSPLDGIPPHHLLLWPGGPRNPLPHDIDSPYALRLKEKYCRSEFYFSCCRRNTTVSTPRSRMRFHCFSCGIPSICHVCAEICHRFHRVKRVYPGDRSSPVDKDDCENDVGGVVKVKDVKRSSSNTFVLRNAAIAARRAMELEKFQQNKRATTHSLPASWFKKERKKKITVVPFSTSVLREMGMTDGELKKIRSPLVPVTSSSSSPTSKKVGTQSRLAKPAFDRTHPRSYRDIDITAEEEEESGSCSAPISAVSESAGCCRCGLLMSRCHILPTIPEVDEVTGRPFDNPHRRAAVVLQGAIRSYLYRIQRAVTLRERKKIRHRIVAEYYHKHILDPIWNKFHSAWETFRRSREMREMAIEDDNKRKFDYNFRLQRAIGGMDAMFHGFKELYGSASIQLPRVVRSESSGEIRPSFSFSAASARQQLLCIHHTRRASPEAFARAASMFPQYDSRERLVADPDMATITDRYTRDARGFLWRRARVAVIVRHAEALQQRAAGALAALMARREAKKKLLREAEAIMRARNNQQQKMDLTPIIISNTNDSEFTQEDRIFRAVQQVLANKEKLYDEVVIRDVAEEDATFDMYEKVSPPPQRRRYSIADPTNMYRRATAVPSDVRKRCFMRRRRSEPPNLRRLYPRVADSGSSGVAGVKNSLELFLARKETLERLIDPTCSSKWAQRSAEQSHNRTEKVLSSVWLNPRLPLDLFCAVKEPRRRSSIADPERLAKQIDTMFDIRSYVSSLHAKRRESSFVVRRRRSFDLGETAEASCGLHKALDYEFEEDDHTISAPTVAQLKHDRVHMDVLSSKVPGLQQLERESREREKDRGSFGA